MNETSTSPDDILSYWFETLVPHDWWSKSVELDSEIRMRFSATLTAAKRCELFEWRATAHGRLAEILVLDQFSRHIHRDTAEAFAADPLALALAQEAVRAGADQKLELPQHAFMYLPYMHSESRVIHKLSTHLFDQPGLEENLKFAHNHKAIIDQFGRFPHRNQALSRETTAEEAIYLAQPDTNFWSSSDANDQHTPNTR